MLMGRYLLFYLVNNRVPQIFKAGSDAMVTDSAFYQTVTGRNGLEFIADQSAVFLKHSSIRGITIQL